VLAATALAAHDRGCLSPVLADLVAAWVGEREVEPR
jgi:hypothetical protein